MCTVTCQQFNDFNVYSLDNKNIFIHINLTENSFYQGFVRYFLDESRLLQYVENKANLTFSPDKRNYITLYKHLGYYIDDFNLEKLPATIEDEVLKILADEYQLNDPGDVNLQVRLDKIGKIGEYLFCNLLSEYFKFNCVIPKVHLTTDFNMSIYGIDTLFYSTENDMLLLGESKLSKSLKNGIGLINKSLQTYEKQIKDEFVLILSNEYISTEPLIDEIDIPTQYFLAWAREEIHEDWCVIKAMERGYLIHNGQIPMGTRMLQLDYYESIGTYNKLLCTSTLLEGVNTTAKNIIITKPSRMSDRNDNRDDFSAFDFFNLVGRTGRLNQHFIGNAYYIKAPSDPEYQRIDAIRSIKFEITDDSKDIDIQKGNIEKYPDVVAFLNHLGISIEEYHTHIGSRLRFETVKAIYLQYRNMRPRLIDELQRFIDI